MTDPPHSSISYVHSHIGEALKVCRCGCAAKISEGATWAKGHHLRGLALTAEHKGKLAAAKRGTTLTAKHRAKIGAAIRGRTLSEEHKRRIGDSHRGWEVTDETKANMRSSALARHARGDVPKRMKNTGPELAVQAWLRSHGIPFETHVSQGGFNWDIRLDTGALIEVNGCYWHACPECGHGGRARTVERDAERRGWADAHGVTFVTLWEHEVAEVL